MQHPFIFHCHIISNTISPIFPPSSRYHSHTQKHQLCIRLFILFKLTCLSLTCIASPTSTTLLLLLELMSSKFLPTCNEGLAMLTSSLAKVVVILLVYQTMIATIANTQTLLLLLLIMMIAIHCQDEAVLSWTQSLLKTPILIWCSPLLLTSATLQPISVWLHATMAMQSTWHEMEVCRLYRPLRRLDPWPLFPKYITCNHTLCKLHPHQVQSLQSPHQRLDQEEDVCPITQLILLYLQRCLLAPIITVARYSNDPSI